MRNATFRIKKLFSILALSTLVVTLPACTTTATTAGKESSDGAYFADITDDN
jgi:hypothetical protein